MQERRKWRQGDGNDAVVMVKQGMVALEQESGADSDVPWCLSLFFLKANGMYGVFTRKAAQIGLKTTELYLIPNDFAMIRKWFVEKSF